MEHVGLVLDPLTSAKRFTGKLQVSFSIVVFNKWAIPCLFRLFSFFSHDKYSPNNTNDKSVDVMLWTQTRGGRMVGTDESAELWRHPFFHSSYLDICDTSKSIGTTFDRTYFLNVKLTKKLLLPCFVKMLIPKALYNGAIPSCCRKTKICNFNFMLMLRI